MSDKKDISERILISPAALMAWSKIAQFAVQALSKKDLHRIGEETITLNPYNKTLTVSCAMGDNEISMVIPEDHWMWNN